MSRGLQWSLMVTLWVGLGSGAAFPADPAPPASPKPQPASPLSPEESLQHIQVDPDCRVELVAAEPDVSAPVSIAFDEKGQLWVVEMGDYPNGPAPGEAPKSRIRILTDDNGDGRFDKPRVFVDGLLFANSLMHWDGGVLVTTDGKLVYFKDTDNDGKADLREVWFEGFATENPQLRCNHPTLGPDNWIYVANGLRNGKVKAVRPAWPRKAPDSAKLGEPVDIAGRDFRFNPFTGECEAVSGYGQFGLTFDDAGNRYVCSNRNPCMRVLIEDRYLKMNPNVTVPSVYVDVSPAGEKSKLYPISRAWTTSNLHAGQFSAACGLIIYRGTALPKEFYGQNFTCDPTGNLVHCDYWHLPADLRPQGREFLASDETWFRPVNTAIGPDGALYIVDMYRAVIEHPDYMPTELKTRPDLSLGSERGRIWRVVAKTPKGEPGGVSPRSLPLPSAPTEIAPLVDDPNSWHRDTAHRLIVERQDKSAEATLRQVLTQSSTPYGAAVSLRTLDGLGLISSGDLIDVMQRELMDASIPEPKPEFSLAIAEAVRLSESFVPAEERLVSTLFEVARQNQTIEIKSKLHFVFGHYGDRFIAERVKQSIEDIRSPGEFSFMKFPPVSGIPSDMNGMLTERAIALAERPGLTQIFLTMSENESTSILLEPTVRGASPEELEKILTRILHKYSNKAVLQMANTLKSRGITMSSIAASSPELQKMWDTFVKAAIWELTDGQQLRDTLPLGAIPCLQFAKPADSVPVLRSLLESELPVEGLSAALDVAAGLPDPEAIDLLLTKFPQRTPALRSAIISALMRTEPRIVKLLDMVAANEISFIEIGSTRLASLQQIKTPEIQERVKKLIAANAPADRSKVLAEYQAALTHEHDPLRGRELFAKNCAQCHKIGEIGVEVAPNISDSRVKTQEQLLVDILDPNRAVDNNYFSYTLIETSGKVSTGIISSETSSSVTLKQPEGKTITIPRSEIEELKPNGMSLMPVGFEKQLTVAQLADVISFVKNWRYLDGQVPKEVIK
ncbi:MAG: PVC-type heme-binding CxxCH protein [Planctomycetaceae bacterium]